MGIVLLKGGGAGAGADAGGGNGDAAPFDPGSRLPADPGEKITDEMLAGLSWQQQQATFEEYFYRQTFMRFGFPCDRNPMHNYMVCPKCRGDGYRVAPQGEKAPCSTCTGNGVVESTPMLVWGCKHVYPQDEVHPDGLVRHPRGYYCCFTCRRLIDNKRFKFATELVARCPKCIAEESLRIGKINPEKLLDLFCETA